MTQADFWLYFPLGPTGRPPHRALGAGELLQPDDPACLIDQGRSQRSPRGACAAKSRLRVGVGLILVVTGLIGVILPIIPGVPLLLAGLAMIGLDHPALRPAVA